MSLSVPFHTKLLTSAFRSSARSVVTVLVVEADEQTSFEVNADVLASSSMTFKEHLDYYDQQQELKPLVINNVTVEAFDTFIKWIGAGHQPTSGAQRIL